jgi:rhamnosyl/mannosyltransferase
MTLRICHLGKFYPPAPGGVETHVQTLARAQARAGADVQVVCANHRDARGVDVTWKSLVSTPTVNEVDEGVRVTRLGRRASVSRLDLCPQLIGAVRAMCRNVDILHVHAPNPTMFLALAGQPLLPMLVVTHHSDVIKQRFLGRVFAPLEWGVHQRTSLVLTTSDAYVDGSSVLQRMRQKVKCLPLGLRLEPFVRPSDEAIEHRARLRARLGEPLWLSVGRLVYYKGLATAVDALAEVSGRLLVVGTGPDERALKARALERGVADRIEWAGNIGVDELVGAYHAATALWFPSNARSEGFGLVQVEAMASGCPVINSAVAHSGVPWVSRDGESGLTVPVDNPRALADASRRLLLEPGLRDRLASAAARRATLEFDDTVMAERSLELYAQAFQHRRGQRSTSPKRERPVAIEPGSFNGDSTIA